MRHCYIPSSSLCVDRSYNDHKIDSYDTNASSYDLDLHEKTLTHTHTHYTHIVSNAYISIEWYMYMHLPSTESNIHLSRKEGFSGPQSPLSLVSSCSILAHSEAVNRSLYSKCFKRK